MTPKTCIQNMEVLLSSLSFSQQHYHWMERCSVMYVKEVWTERKQRKKNVRKKERENEKKEVTKKKE